MTIKMHGKELKMDFHRNSRQFLRELAEQQRIADEQVTVVSARTLTPEEAIGNPECRDFPLLKGREVMVEATFRNDKGQAYTDMPGEFTGSVRELLSLPLENNFQRAIFTAGLNAVMRHYGQISHTVHCRDREPGLCAAQLPGYINKVHGQPKVAFVGFQPAMIDRLRHGFEIRVVDLDGDHVGKEKFGLTIERAEKTEEILSWGDIVLATGSTCVNGTLNNLVRRKPVIFYGVTIAGMAAIHQLQRYCPCAH